MRYIVLYSKLFGFENGFFDASSDGIGQRTKKLPRPEPIIKPVFCVPRSYFAGQPRRNLVKIKSSNVENGDRGHDVGSSFSHSFHPQSPVPPEELLIDHGSRNLGPKFRGAASKMRKNGFFRGHGESK